MSDKKSYQLATEDSSSGYLRVRSKSYDGRNKSKISPNDSGSLLPPLSDSLRPPVPIRTVSLSPRESLLYANANATKKDLSSIPSGTLPDIKIQELDSLFNKYQEPEIPTEEAPLPPILMLTKNDLVSCSPRTIFIEEKHSTRRKICNEILDSEKTYLDNMKKFFDDWIPKLKHAMKILKSDLVEIINRMVSCVEIIIGIHQKLFDSLAPRVELWREDKKVAEIFLQVAPYFRVYRNYASNYNAVSQAIEKLKSKSPVFSKSLSELAKQSNVLYIGHYLIMPIQRIPRYELLLKDLLKNTNEDHPDFVDLQKAINTIKEVADYVNSFSNHNTNDTPEKIIDLGLEDVIIPTRQYMKECIFMTENLSTSEKRLSRFILFSDILIRDELSIYHGKCVHQKISKMPLRSDWCWPTQLCWVQTLSKHDHRSISPRNILRSSKEDLASKLDFSSIDPSANVTSYIKIVGPDNTFVLYVTDDSVANEWVDTMQSLVNSSEDDKSKRYGEFTFPSSRGGGHYKGWWMNGQRHGNGTYANAGCKYEGSWINGIQEGEGTMNYSTGASYTGNWKAGNHEGYGKLVDPSGTIYEGTWCKNKKNGLGKLLYPNGSYFEGEWMMDVISGQGKLNLKSGFTYKGEWFGGMYHGFGVLLAPNGDSYKGNWSEGKKYGQGTMVYADGSKYDGFWLNNQRHGTGRLDATSLGPARGFIYDGLWAEGVESGEGVKIYCDSTIYSGSWKDGKPHGHGEMTFNLKLSTYEKYIGEWYHGKMQGKGELRWANGSIFRGQFKDDQMYSGQLEYPNGTMFEGRIGLHGTILPDSKCVLLPNQSLRKRSKSLKKEQKKKSFADGTITSSMSREQFSSQKKTYDLSQPIHGVLNNEGNLESNYNDKKTVVVPFCSNLPLLEHMNPIF
eukprot:TRINITY_DN1407_c0_g1_i5.p1 TRINITY_DN1407_c0_g1~~TRINITY_DN1407_c0_g1_i5.p1  ORF type:complete len:910 (+),score=111.45 TRINITY_DN1407_c0_g1_i5:24-2732(+)